MTQSYTCMKRWGRRCRGRFLNFIDHFSRHIVNVLLISAFLSHLKQEHGRPTAVQAFGIGILKLLWAHILSSHTATCTCTCSSNLCSNPVASYKTLWIIPVTFTLTVGVYWCWIYAVSFSHSTDGSPSAQHYPSQSIPTNQLQSQLQQHFADLAAKTPLPELLGKVQNLGFPSSCTFVLNMLERWAFAIHLFCFSRWSKNFPTI